MPGRIAGLHFPTGLMHNLGRRMEKRKFRQEEDNRIKNKSHHAVTKTTPSLFL
jgi:hypothetical protein